MFAMLRGMNTTLATHALQRLLEGNSRFVEDRLNRVQLGTRLREVAPAQAPFAAVLGCSDSRVPAEIVFDCSLGDLFVVRSAGHVLSPAVLGSLEFATLRLRLPLIVVLGHTRCGAIQAAISARDDEPHPGSIGALIEGVRPAVRRVRALPGNTLSHAVMAHIEDTVVELCRSPVLAPLIEDGSLKIAGARYDLDTGDAQLIA
jgi:carbonic anhydrase